MQHHTLWYAFNQIPPVFIDPSRIAPEDGQRLISRHGQFYGGTAKSPLELRDNLGFALARDLEGRYLTAMSILSLGHVDGLHNMVIGVSEPDSVTRFEFVNQYEAQRHGET